MNYKINNDEACKVSEPVVVIDSVVIDSVAIDSCQAQLCREEDFDSLWQRSLSVEEFRSRCVAKLSHWSFFASSRKLLFPSPSLLGYFLKKSF